MKKTIIKKFKFFVFLLFVALGIYFLFAPKLTDIKLPQTQTEPATATIVLVGDIMLDRGVELKIKQNNDWRWPFLKIAEELKGADIVFGNMEGPISDKGTKVGSIYSFRDDPKVIEGLIYAGFNVLSVANNHAFDYGRTALEDTFLRLKNDGIDYVGGGKNATESGSPVIKEINGTKIAFLAYTDLCPLSWKATIQNSGINCVSENDLEKIKKEIQESKNNVDVLIVSLHSGQEYSQIITDFQTNFAKSAIDAGADMIIGHHPHVVQKNEIYKGKYIFYSLGNFVFDQNFSKETMQGQIIKIIVKEKKVSEVIPIDIVINNSLQPELAVNIKTPVEIKPLIDISSDKLEQGDTLIVRVSNIIEAQKITGTFDTAKLDFFQDTAGDWVGILGIDAKKTPGKYKLVINLPSGEKTERNINIIKRNFPTTVLTFTPELEEQGYNATSVVEAIITNDGQVLKNAFSTSSPYAYFTKSFDYPLKNIVNVGAFGNIRKSGDISLQHLGVDLEATMNTPIYAVNVGIIKTTAGLINYGNTTIIDHGLGIFSLYLHLNTFKISEGQKVKKGDIIGYSGNTGYSIAPHLHFSMKLNGASIDPLRFIETTRLEMK